jgi:hypothetical protein
MFWTFTSVLDVVCMKCLTVFCSSLILFFAGVVQVFSDDFEVVPLAPIITGITFFCIIHSL